MRSKTNRVRDDLFWVYSYLEVSSQKILSITVETLM